VAFFSSVVLCFMIFSCAINIPRHTYKNKLFINYFLVYLKSITYDA